MADIKIFGEGSSKGGIFKKVRIFGQGRITTDINCDQIKVYGDGSFSGNASVDQFTMFGSVSMKQSLNAQVVKVFGSLDVEESLTCDKAKIKGFANVIGDISLENLHVVGGLKVKGLLNANQLTMNLQVANSEINEIGGETITIKSRSLNPFKPKHRLDVKVVEGDKIYLEHTVAAIVRGNEVTIGPNCEIKSVEYSTSLKKISTSQIDLEKKIN
ncbi:hypothetical protein H1D32_11715 [Anaerobacillus sp. CMMVII]|uniref:hypothetical protein n=1 Tax=Anaerobacillus sp. CMMVII TaxID=2755588 RepID=UPI0021B6F0FE|nr:hypothetical protein [Anaerobacillus sp. CMMVII]MCT8138358.1 hypothetical protein [Anaerobacillus sp. CMMVII]